MDEWRLVDKIRGIALGPLAAGALGPGDDAAVLPWTQDEDLVATTDLIAEGTHFHADTNAVQTGRFAAHVNLSDLAAMGAAPRGLLAAVGAPGTTSAAWIEGVARGLVDGLKPWRAPLIGGDTKEAAARIIVGTALGAVPRGSAVTRSGAQPGDVVVITGPIGGPGAALHLLTLGAVKRAEAMQRVHDVTPRIDAGIALRETGAHAMIDTSDGIARAASLIARASQVAVHLDMERLPLDAWAQEAFASPLPDDPAWRHAVLGVGGEYELLATLPPARLEAARAAVARAGGALVPVGTVRAGATATLELAAGDQVPLSCLGWKHRAPPGRL